MVKHRSYVTTFLLAAFHLRQNVSFPSFSGLTGLRSWVAREERQDNPILDPSYLFVSSYALTFILLILS